MSYMRGTYYIWRGNKLYVCTPDGNVGLPMAIFDELVAMRWAQIPVAARKRIEKRAIKKWQGNVDCDALCKKYGEKTMRDLVEEGVKEEIEKNQK